MPVSYTHLDVYKRQVQLSAIGGAVTPQIARETADETGLEIVLTHSDLNRIDVYKRQAILWGYQPHAGWK